MGSPEGTFDTKLHEAVRNGSVYEVKEALKQGYDPNLIGLFQWNPMHEAADNGDREILKLLIQKKGDPNKLDYMQGRTPMHYATEKGHIECLKLLIDCGGRYDIKDDTGRDCLDLSSPASRKMLERLKMRDLMFPTDNQTGTLDKDSALHIDKSPDQHSIYSCVDSDATSRRSSVSSIQDKQPIIGYLYMSVEYHTSKQTLKVRIWQLTDILLPPPHTSGIHSVYVKSFLLPDKKKETKRKTEDIRVDTSEAHVKWKDKSSIQHVFMPSSFKFKSALEYNKVNSDMVRERNLQIEVCITQRYSHRSFLIGMLTMSLKKAVKKVVREKIALIPCMNHTIPSNMKVYCASELDISSNKVFYSTPNVKVNIQESIRDDNSEKAASNPDLKQVKYSPSVEVDMKNMTGSIPNVPKLNLDDATLDESGYSSEFHVSMPGDLESPDSDQSGVRHSWLSKNVLSSVDEDSTDRVLESVKEKLTKKTQAVTKVENGIEITDLDEEESVSITTDIGNKSEVGIPIKPDENEPSRPETPTWDYYDVPTDIVSAETEIATSPWTEGAAPVVLPMETNLGIHQTKESSGNKPSDIGVKQKEKVRKKSKKRSSPAIPGRAIPLVPEIIVVNTDSIRDKTKPANTPETHVNINSSSKQGLPKIVVDNGENSEHNVSHVLDVDVKSATGIGKNREVQNREDTKTDKKVDSTAEKEKLSGDTGSARAICVIEPVDQEVARLNSGLVDVGISVENDKSVDNSNSENIENTKHSLPVARPRTKKLRKVREGGTKSELGSKVKSEPNKKQSASNKGEFSGDKSIHKTSNRSNEKSPTILSDIKVVSSKMSSESLDNSDGSIVIDMDKLSFSNSDAHVIELDDDISITELSEDSQLFSHSSVISSTFIDIDGGTESFYHLPERVSPTKYMIPMQVYMEEDTSCDESLPTDRSDKPITVHDTQKFSSEI